MEKQVWTLGPMILKLRSVKRPECYPHGPIHDIKKLSSVVAGF